MKSIEIVRYSPDMKTEWDHFVQTSRNGTFLHQRDFVEYHSDRFDDWSLVIYDDKHELLALLPAHRRDDHLYSHQGLTYGGFITGESMKIGKMLSIFEHLKPYLQENNLYHLHYKSIPYIYHQVPSDEDVYAIQQYGGQVVHQTLLSVVGCSQRFPFQTRRNRMINKARKAQIQVQPSDDLKAYWEILVNVLKTFHNTEPVHTLEEMELLRGRFPKHIRLYAAYLQDRMIAGVLIFESIRVARSQYIANTPEGRDLGGLDLLFEYLIHDVYADKPFFSFGSSLDPSTGALNWGLLDQKEGFGGRAVVQHHYDLQFPAAD